MSKATSRSVNKSIIVAVILTAIIAGGVVFVGTYAYFALQSAPAQQLVTQPKPTLQKFKVSGHGAHLAPYFLLVNAAKERGIWVSNGLDPEFVSVPGRTNTAADLKEQVASGTKIGLNFPSEVFIAISAGVPIKIVAAQQGESTAMLLVRVDSPIRTVQELNGKKIGIYSTADWSPRFLGYMSNKFSIKAESVPLGNLTNMVVALKLGRIEGFITAEAAVLRLVDSGELRLIVRSTDVQEKPFAVLVLWATQDLIEQNPDLVRRFVKATLETVKYLKENPSYSTDLFIKETNAPRDLAEKAVSLIDWSPSGRGSGADLTLALRNAHQYNKDTGGLPASAAALKAEEVLDLRFLP